MFLKWTISVFVCLCSCIFVNCLFDDQVGKFDWRQQYIGNIKFAYIDPVIAGSQKFIVATDENVIACLSTRTGSIIWRQILEGGIAGSIDAMSENGDLITVSGGGQFIRGWDPNTGVLKWETSFPQTAKENRPLHFHVSSSTKEIIRVEALQNKNVKVSVYNFLRGSMKTSGEFLTNWFDEQTDCKFASGAYFVCLEGNKIQLLSIKDSGKFIPVTLSSLGISDTKGVSIISFPYQESTERPVFGIQTKESVFLLQIQPPGIKTLKQRLPKSRIVTSTLIDDKLVLFSLMDSPNKAGFTVTAVDLEGNKDISYLNGALTISEERGKLETFRVLPYIKKDHGVSYKAFLTFQDHSILVIHQQGRLVWSREEALSKIVSSEVLDLPLSENDANIEQEFGQTDTGVISMFLTRIKSQVHLLQAFLLQVLIGDGESIGNEKNTLTRDTFGLHKIIVVLTEPGKVFGIDNLSGLIIWSHFEKDFAPFEVIAKPSFPLFVQRTTSHFPYPPVCTAIGRSPSSGRSRIYSFHPITGSTLESKELPYEVIQVMPAGMLSYYLREILLLDKDLNVHVYPESKDIFKYRGSHYFFTASASTGRLVGYSFDADGKSSKDLKAVEVWRTNLPQKIITVATKRPTEHVHSQGRVMGDRSVLYKYLNPNLAAVFTEGSDSVQKTFCNLYLVDIVTGAIVYSASHKRCKGPVHVVHSENFVIYSFYNDKSRRVEISSLELFEGRSQSNTTAFSSFSPPLLPLIEHQTFIFPSSVIAISDTVTERGMTNKHLLIVLPSGGILELPKTFLDPRRPVTPLPEHREEGLIPYIPELPIMSEGIINYNQSVLRVKGIVTAPSGLESTCLVFVHGLDLFYTRITPSKTFDILKDDFDHYLISVVLLGLLVLSYTTKRLAARKTLRAAWK